MKINNYTKDEQLEILHSLCNRIYIAVNISNSSENWKKLMDELSSLFRDENYN